MNWARAFFGILIVAAGALLLFDNLGLIDAGEILSQWWPAAVMVGGALAFAANPRHWIAPMLLVLGGGVVLLRTTGVIDTIELLLPAVLIVVGLLVLFGNGLGSKTTSSDTTLNSFNLFSGSTLVSDSKQFQGGTIGAIFGGAEVDLRNAALAPEAGIDVFAAFGGVEISVPRGWRVDIRGFPIFGGYENATSKEGLNDDAPYLRIDATVLFGGLEVKH